MFVEAAKTAQTLLKLAPANDIAIAILATYRADCRITSVEATLRLATRDVADTDPAELDRVKEAERKLRTGIIDDYVGIARHGIVDDTTALVCTEFFAGLQLAAKSPTDFSDWMKLLIDKARQYNIFTLQTRTIVVPALVHSGLPQAHFICWKIDLDALAITLYDSCSETTGIRENFRLLRTFAVALTESREEAWSFHRADGWPKQHNGTDCGIFCLAAVLVLCCGVELNTLYPTRDSATTLPHTNRLRQRFFGELQQQQLDRTRERAEDRALWEAMENVAPTGPTVAAVSASVPTVATVAPGAPSPAVKSITVRLRRPVAIAAAAAPPASVKRDADAPLREREVNKKHAAEPGNAPAEDERPALELIDLDSPTSKHANAEAIWDDAWRNPMDEDEEDLSSMSSGE
jgi:hypothetical protein